MAEPLHPRRQGPRTLRFTVSTTLVTLAAMGAGPLGCPKPHVNEGPVEEPHANPGPTDPPPAEGGDAPAEGEAPSGDEAGVTGDGKSPVIVNTGPQPEPTPEPTPDTKPKVIVNPGPQPTPEDPKSGTKTAPKP